MADLQDDLALRVRQLERVVADLDTRLRQLESPTGDEAARDVTAPPPFGSEASAPDAAAAETALTTAGTLTLVGRTSVTLGGAFLLRALTESGRVPVAVGVSIGLAYALVWMAAAYRAGPDRRASAFFHGLTSLLIALPLLLEAAARFGAYSASTSALFLLVVSTLGLVTAGRQRVPALAAIAGIGALLDGAAIAVATATPVVFAFFTVAVALVVNGLVRPHGTSWLRWPAAAVANLFVLALVGRSAGTPIAPPGEVLAAAGAFSAAYAWIIARGLVGRGRLLGAFDVLQAMAVVLLGIAGTVMAAGQIGPAAGLVASLVALAIGAACYAVGLGLSSDRPHRMPTVHFFTSAGVAIVLIGTTTLLGGGVLVMLFVGMSVVFSWLGARRFQPTFLLHGAVYVLAATIPAGLPALMGRAWLLPLDTWPDVDPSLALVALAAALGVLGPRLPAGDVGGRLTVVARTMSAVVLVSVTVTWALSIAGALVVDAPAAGPLAALRSAALSGAAALSALAGRIHRARALGRLAYPLLSVCAVKFLIEDFWRSGPVMLFVALACFGVALIVTARSGARA